MNCALVKIGIGIVSAGVGALVSHILTKRHYVKEMDALCEECTKDVHDARMETKKYKDYIKAIEPNGINADIWNNLDNVLNLQKPAKKPEDPSTDEVLSKARTEKDYTDYTSYYKTAPIADSKKEETPLVVPNNHKDVRYISDFEYDENEWGFDTQYLNFYIESELLFDDVTDQMIEEYDIVKYINEDLESLRRRFAMHRDQHPNEVHEFYVLNEQHAKLYCICECQGVGPR